MSIQSEREQKIKAYLESNSDSKTGRTERLEIEGKVVDLPIYRLPIKLLAFNTENGRFVADLLSIEEERGRKLDPLNPDDASIIREILIKKYPTETNRLHDDLKRVGQSHTGVITSAGIVINGNRRMAILTKLHEETHQDKFEYLEVVILPRHLDDAEIYKVEARLQYAREFKVAFGPVNELLKIREGLKKGMSESEMAELLGRDEEYVKEHLEQLKLLEEYSMYFWGKVDYKKIEEEDITERMTSVVENLRKLVSEGFDLNDVKKLLELQFNYIKAGASLKDIRCIKKIGRLEKSKQRYFDALDMLKKGEVTAEPFKDLVDNVSEEVRIKVRELKPIVTILRILDKLKGFRDEQNEITPEIREKLIDISTIIDELVNPKH